MRPLAPWQWWDGYSSAVGARFRSFFCQRCSVVVAGMGRGYLWSAVIGGGRGEFFLDLAEDVGFGRGAGAVGKC